MHYQAGSLKNWAITMVFDWSRLKPIVFFFLFSPVKRIILNTIQHKILTAKNIDELFIRQYFSSIFCQPL